MAKKFDVNKDIKHDVLNTADSVWYLVGGNRYIATILEINNDEYTIAYYSNGWELTTVTYNVLFPRVREQKDSKIFEIFDLVYIVSDSTKSFGVVVGYELGLHVVIKYANKIWRRIVVPTSKLEHCEDNYDEVLFNNRRIILTLDWIKWTLPNGKR